MSKPIVIAVPHNLGVEEARRRIAAEVDQLKNDYGNKLGYSEVVWSGDTANIRVVALMQEVKGRIDVLADSVRIEITLPWFLAKKFLNLFKRRRAQRCAPGHPGRRRAGSMLRSSAEGQILLSAPLGAHS